MLVFVSICHNLMSSSHVCAFVITRLHLMSQDLHLGIALAHANPYCTDQCHLSERLLGSNNVIMMIIIIVK